MRTSASGIVDGVLPFVRQGATALALAMLIAGCDCSSDFVVPLTEEEGATLRKVYDDDDLPLDVCNQLCVPPDVTSPDGGPPPETAEEAGYGVRLCHVVRDEKGPAVLCKGYFPDACIGGRRPARLAARSDGASASTRDRRGAGRTGSDDRATRGGGPCAEPKQGVSPEGAAFGALVRMESASVLAFVELAVELGAHGAPDALVRRALAAAIDEVRHARTAAKIARGLGAEPERAVVAIAGVRSLPALLHDNAVEGVVLEGWGALAAAHDARTARDPETRRALEGIAADELAHAGLARAIDVWAAERAGAAARARAREAQAEALRGLVTAVESGATVGLGAGGTDRAVDRVRRFACALEGSHSPRGFRIGRSLSA